jgi:thiol:disulfide interchange protein DsbA
LSAPAAARAWQLVLLAALALSVAACGRGASVKKHVNQTAPATHHAAASAGSTGSPARNDADVGPNSDVDAPEEDHQDKSDVSLEHLAALPADAQLPAGRWRPGVSYMPLVPAQTTGVAAGKVEVLEVFWLGCPHCYALEPQLQRWLKSKPPYVQFVRVPVMWGPMHRAHARLYYTLLALGHEDLVQKAFDTIQHGDPLVANSDEESLNAQRAFARANGIRPDDYTKAYTSQEVVDDLERAERLTQVYQVNSVPLMVINGKYATDPGMAGSGSAVFTLIDDLAAAEHNHSRS